MAGSEWRGGVAGRRAAPPTVPTAAARRPHMGYAARRQTGIVRDREEVAARGGEKGERQKRNARGRRGRQQARKWVWREEREVRTRVLV